MILSVCSLILTALHGGTANACFVRRSSSHRGGKGAQATGKPNTGEGPGRRSPNPPSLAVEMSFACELWGLGSLQVDGTQIIRTWNGCLVRRVEWLRPILENEGQRIWIV
jgi:hypothetical protein